MYMFEPDFSADEMFLVESVIRELWGSVYTRLAPQRINILRRDSPCYGGNHLVGVRSTR